MYRYDKAPKFVKVFFASKVGMWIDAVSGALLVSSCQLLIPALFACRAAPQEDLSGTKSSSGRHLLSGIYVPRKFVQYTCGEGDFSEMATLMLQNEVGLSKLESSYP